MQTGASTVAAIESAEQAFDVERVAVAEEVGLCLERHRHRAAAKEIRLEAEPPAADLAVRADAQAVAQAFERFAEPGIQPSGERALGLGLPLAKQFVEAHGGRSELLSEVGEGTLVTVELPRR